MFVVSNKKMTWLTPRRPDVSTHLRLPAHTCCCGALAFCCYAMHARLLQLACCCAPVLAARMLLRTLLLVCYCMPAPAAAHAHGDRPRTWGPRSTCARFPRLLMKTPVT
jgi:hypothetical protein